MSKKSKSKPYITAYFKVIPGTKQKNRRVTVTVLKKSDENQLIFEVITKRLHDFKTRDIVETSIIYSQETFELLYAIMASTLNSKEYEELLTSLETK
jgi:hypothetical protein